MAMEMEMQLYAAAMAGDVNTLNKLIQSDPLILDRFPLSASCSSEAPLHVAAAHGNSDFVAAILARNRELASECDSLGRTLLHAAAIEGHVEVLRELLRVNSEACLVRDKDGRLPLHLAAIGGRVQVAAELGRVRLGGDRGGSVLLHLCVEYGSLEALKVLVVKFEDLVNLRDEDGNTALHLAAVFKQFEIAKCLLSRSDIESNAVNAAGFTAGRKFPV